MHGILSYGHRGVSHGQVAGIGGSSDDWLMSGIKTPFFTLRLPCGARTSPVARRQRALATHRIQGGVFRIRKLSINAAPSLIGSYFNLPITVLSGPPVQSGQIVDFFGMRYVVPFVISPGTILAVNVGGAVIPTLMSAYLVLRYQLWLRAAIAAAIVAVIVHSAATPVAGMGIAVPVFVPVVATAILALMLSREYAAPLAYIGGSMGTLIGADILNLDKIGSLGAPIASIGGAGTFDGIFLTGILAVLLAGLVSPSRLRPAS